MWSGLKKCIPGNGKSSKKTDSGLVGRAIPISDVGFRVNSVELKDFDTGRVFWTSTDPEEIFMQTESVERKVKVIYYRQLTTKCKRYLQMS
jgi:hypothetical protein